MVKHCSIELEASRFFFILGLCCADFFIERVVSRHRHCSGSGNSRLSFEHSFVILLSTIKSMHKGRVCVSKLASMRCGGSCKLESDECGCSFGENTSSKIRTNKEGREGEERRGTTKLPSTKRTASKSLHGINRIVIVNKSRTYHYSRIPPQTNSICSNIALT